MLHLLLTCCLAVYSRLATSRQTSQNVCPCQCPMYQLLDCHHLRCVLAANLWLHSHQQQQGYVTPSCRHPRWTFKLCCPPPCHPCWRPVFNRRPSYPSNIRPLSLSLKCLTTLGVDLLPASTLIPRQSPLKAMRHQKTLNSQKMRACYWTPLPSPVCSD